MKLLETIEYLRFDLIKNNEVDWTVLDDFYDLGFTSKDLQKTIDKFLLSLKSNHSIPGTDYYKLQGISQWITVNKNHTPKQQTYAILAMSTYWDELDLFKL